MPRTTLISARVPKGSPPPPGFTRSDFQRTLRTVDIYQKTKQIVSKSDIDELADLFSGIGGIGSSSPFSSTSSSPITIDVRTVENVEDVPVVAAAVVNAASAEDDALSSMMGRMILGGGYRRKKSLRRRRSGKKTRRVHRK